MKVTGVEQVGGSGYSLEELSAYHDRGRTPRIAAIEGDAQCRALLASMEHLAGLSRELVDREADAPLPESWYDGVMREVVREFRAGRDIPLRDPADGVALVVTEGALRELVRHAGDAVPGVLVGRVGIASAGDALDIRISVSVRFGRRVPDAVADVRAAVRAAIDRHGDLRAGRIDVTVDDVHQEEDR